MPIIRGQICTLICLAGLPRFARCATIQNRLLPAAQDGSICGTRLQVRVPRFQPQLPSPRPACVPRVVRRSCNTSRSTARRRLCCERRRSMHAALGSQWRGCTTSPRARSIPRLLIMSLMAAPRSCLAVPLPNSPRFHGTPSRNLRKAARHDVSHLPRWASAHAGARELLLQAGVKLPLLPARGSAEHTPALEAGGPFCTSKPRFSNHLLPDPGFRGILSGHSTGGDRVWCQEYSCAE